MLKDHWYITFPEKHVNFAKPILPRERNVINVWLKHWGKTNEPDLIYTTFSVWERATLVKYQLIQTKYKNIKYKITNYVYKWSSIEYVRSDFSDFVILDPPSLLVRAHRCCFIKKIWQIYFANYYQSKNHKQRYKNKDTTVQSYWKISN